MPPHSGVVLTPQLQSEGPRVLTPVASAAPQGPPRRALVCLAGQSFFFLKKKTQTFIMVKLTLFKASDLITFDLCP